ncbi:hypothetical protein ACE1TI_17445 [Alteribacillus sp. JSM 102045]|uniref:hypothetical protein n=1 Tax=Alteribacillus sp. JSM 102045 TaxID=1562101 RepID=UPI0035C0F546
MPAFVSNNRYILYSGVIGLFLINIFVRSEIVEYIIGLLAIPMLIISFFKATRLFRILGTFFTGINLSALPLSQHVLLEYLAKIKKKWQDSFISQTTLRAFSVALAWSPMEIMVAITIDTTGVGYVYYLSWLLICSLFVLIIDSLRGSIYLKVRCMNQQEAE